MSNDDFIMLKGVRVSFPHLFSKPTINGEEGKCGAAFMLDPNAHKTEIDMILGTIKEMAKDKLKGKVPPTDKLCLRDGEDKGRAEYEGYKILSANHRDRPIVIAANGKDVIHDEKDSPIYAGCHVNAKVRLWVQNNNYGKRVNCELVAIQFASDGEPLDGSYVTVDEAMSGFDPQADNDDFLAA